MPACKAGKIEDVKSSAVIGNSNQIINNIQKYYSKNTNEETSFSTSIRV